ncbi:hypothetical protein MIMGU_mgv1a022373mg [Erythranthe guttata]|uniref:RNA-binding protein 48 n=1 Tax=Erythranthe guttata TaxID=4155 RepID=A0A022Q3I0_ERYGU|nr:hypothetical protein MIMGU_mgv1a022373mg [Erythranthe guttata]
MPKYKDEPTAVRVYTVCDESKFLIVRNVPSLGCGDQLAQLFSTYGQVEECKPMDAEDCEQYTDVYWIKFHQVNNARFAKRKLDESVFLGNRIQVSYAPQYESLSDTKEKLEGRRKEVLSRLNHIFLSSKSKSKVLRCLISVSIYVCHRALCICLRKGLFILQAVERITNCRHWTNILHEYFPSESMNRTVHLVRDKLNKIQSTSSEHTEAGSSKKARVDNRRRI